MKQISGDFHSIDIYGRPIACCLVVAQQPAFQKEEKKYTRNTMKRLIKKSSTCSEVKFFDWFFFFAFDEMESFSVIHPVLNPTPWIDFFAFWPVLINWRVKLHVTNANQIHRETHSPNWIFSFEETEGEFNTALKLRWRESICAASCTKVIYIQRVVSLKSMCWN